MTINPNNTTAACSGGEPSVDLMQRVWANLYFNESDAGNTFQETLNEVVDWLAARGALPDHDKPYEPQASAPRSASAGDGVPEMPEAAQALSLKHDWCPACHRGWSWRDPNAQRTEALSAPPPVRIDQDVGVRALEKIDVLISNGDRPTVNERNAFEHFGKLNRLLLSIRDIARAAISANTTAGVDVRGSALRDIISWKEDTLGPRPKVQGPYDCAPEITEAFDRGARMAFYRCALRASEALASNPLEGKGAK